jgi:iron complex transport system substrate-binding protein
MRIRPVVLLFGALLFGILTGCDPRDSAPQQINPTFESQSTPGFPRTITDSRGKQITIKTEPQRIVSLAPSNTEILFALGVDKRIVAVTTACDYPEAAKSLPNVGGYPISLEKVQVKNPDLVVTVGTINQTITDLLEKANIPVVVVDPKNMGQNYDAIRILGKAVGADKKADEVVGQMMKEFNMVRSKAGQMKGRPKVAILYQTRPLYTTGPGTFIDDAIRAAGGQNIVDKPLPQNIISPEQVLTAAPEVIICSPAMESEIKRMPGWATGVPAVKNNRFYHAPNSSALVRPGPRLPKAILELAAYLHPEAFPTAPATPPKP